MLAAVVAMTALAGGPVPTDRPLDWALAGVGSGGRALIIQPGVTGGCDQGDPQISVRAGATELVVAVSVKSVQGPEVVCPAIAHLNQPQTVRLAAPVAGRTVSGDLRSARPGFLLESRTPASGPPRVPRVVGLAATDARQVLCSAQIRAVGANRGRVVAQRPAAGVAYRVPTVAAPNGCGGLPARPVARLTVR